MDTTYEKWFDISLWLVQGLENGVLYIWSVSYGKAFILVPGILWSLLTALYLFIYLFLVIWNNLKHQYSSYSWSVPILPFAAQMPPKQLASDGTCMNAGLCQGFVWEELKGEPWGLHALHNLQSSSGNFGGWMGLKGEGRLRRGKDLSKIFLQSFFLD